jgi:hypothetical protein
MQLVEDFQPRILADIRNMKHRGRTVAEVVAFHGIGRTLATRCLDHLVGCGKVIERLRYQPNTRGRAPTEYVAREFEFLESARATSMQRSSEA